MDYLIDKLTTKLHKLQARADGLKSRIACELEKLAGDSPRYLVALENYQKAITVLIVAIPENIPLSPEWLEKGKNYPFSLTSYEPGEGLTRLFLTVEDCEWVNDVVCLKERLPSGQWQYCIPNYDELGE